LHFKGAIKRRLCECRSSFNRKQKTRSPRRTGRNRIDTAQVVRKGSKLRVRTDQPEKGLIMSRRTIVSLAASVIIGIACIATISTDAFAYRRGVGVGRAGVYHGGVYRGGVYRGAAVRRGVAVGVGAAAIGAGAAGAYGAYRCGYYPNPPCQ
jgi:hypothetical protein